MRCAGNARLIAVTAFGAIAIACAIDRGKGVDTTAIQSSPTASAASVSVNPQPDAQRRAAEHGLDVLIDLQSTPGFKPPRPLLSRSDAKLGVPLNVFVVTADQLRAYTAETNPQTLLIPTTRVVYPVLVGTSAVASITVQGEDGKWSPIEYDEISGPELAKSMTALRALNRTTGSPRLVSVLIQGKYSFIATDGDAGLQLTPIGSRSSLNAAALATGSARVVFQAMVPLARAASPEVPR